MMASISPLLLCLLFSYGIQSFKFHKPPALRFIKRIRPRRNPASSSSTAMFDTAKEIMESFSQAFIGGTIGVVSVSIIVELRKAVDKNLENCPYCLGNGEILCGMCCGSKMTSNDPCDCCSGRGLVTCLNCKGDGRITPLILQPRATRDPVSITFSILICFHNRDDIIHLFCPIQEFATDRISIDSP